MAAGIDVFFTGLMLICLYDQQNCPKGQDERYYPNTAWVVKADGPRRVCGWHSREETLLRLKIKKDDFESFISPLCEENAEREVICTFSARDICLLPDLTTNLYKDPSVDNPVVAKKFSLLGFRRLPQEHICNAINHAEQPCWRSASV